MNLKERGITVGDLLIILIIILTSTLIFKPFKNNKEYKTKLDNLEHSYSKETLLSVNYLENLKLG